MSKTGTYFLGIFGVLFFVIPAILGGFQFDTYNHISQFISESYATGTPYGEKLRFFGYIPSGIFLALFAFFAPSYLAPSKFIKTTFLLFGIFYGLGTVVTSIFPCDKGCNPELIDPSISQIIHNISGALTYLIIPIIIILIGAIAKSWTGSKSYSSITLICGIIALIFAGTLMASPKGDFIGLYQRLVEGAILFWVLKTAVYIKNSE